jgi:hypothetical protein
MKYQKKIKGKQGESGKKRDYFRSSLLELSEVPVDVWDPPSQADCTSQQIRSRAVSRRFGS